MTRDLQGLNTIPGMSNGMVVVGDAKAELEATRDKRISDRAVKMAQLKKVPVSIAQALVAGGQAVIAQANKLAVRIDPLTGVPGILPGGTARDKVAQKLQWHADTLRKFIQDSTKVIGAVDKFSAATIYPQGDDLKSQVLQAYTELDAVVEGLDTLDHAWTAMWDEIETRLAALPKAVLAAVKEAAWYAKWTTWVIVGGIVVALGLVGWGVGAGVKSRISGK